MRSTITPAMWPSSAPIRLTYLEEQACLTGAIRPGAVLAQRYELERPLSVRAPGTLWQARHHGRTHAREHNTHVTLQLLDPAIAEDPALLEAFLQEARAAAGIEHAHVTRLLDYGAAHVPGAGLPFVVLEPLVGETLEAHLATQGRLPARELAHIVREAALGLEALHDGGMLHRCLDPAHVFLACDPGSRDPGGRDPGGRDPGDRDEAPPVTKLLFAIEAVFHDHLRLVRHLSHHLSADGWSDALELESAALDSAALGSVALESAALDRERLDTGPLVVAEYQSPEQLLGQGDVDERSDLWSLAVIAFEGLSGTPAFGGASLGERMVQICSGQPNPPPANVALPPGFAQWFQRGVSKRPRERFASARQMADALTHILIEA